MIQSSISPEAQQVIDRLRTLLTQLEKDLEEIRFKASYFELLRLHSQKTSQSQRIVFINFEKLLPVVNGRQSRQDQS